MYEKGLTLWSILFFYYDVAPLGLLRCRPSGACTPSEAGLHTERSRIVHRAEPDCTPSGAGLYTERSRIAHRAEPDCTPSGADCTPSEAEVSRMSTMLEIQGGVS